MAKKSFIDFIDEYLKFEKGRLPAFSKTALNIQQELNKKEPDIKKIEKLIIYDQALTSEVLKMANSSFYRGLAKVSNIRSAIIRLGAREVANIVVLATQKEHFKSKDPLVNDFMKKLWRHSVGCAIGTQWIIKRCGFDSMMTEAFVAGLLHDVGKLLMLAVVEFIRLSKKIKFNPSKELLSEFMDRLHGKYGYELMKEWNLPDIYCEITRDHHNPQPDPHNTLMLAVRLANQACNKMDFSVKTDSSIVLAATTEAGALGLSEVALAELEITLEDSFTFSKSI